MDLFQVVRMANQYMNQHGLHAQGWVFEFDRAKRRAGCCKYRKKVISLSRDFAVRNPDAEVKDTILHEIAHALVGPGNGHNRIWKAKCREIGAKPERCYDSTQVSMPKGKLQAICGGCQQVFYRHRRLKFGRLIYCRKCGPEKGLLKFFEVRIVA